MSQFDKLCQTHRKKGYLQLWNSSCWLRVRYQKTDKQPTEKRGHGLGKYPCPSNSGKWRLVKFSVHYFEQKTRFKRRSQKLYTVYSNDETAIFDSFHIQDSQQLALFLGFLLTLWCLRMIWGLQWTFPGDRSETVHIRCPSARVLKKTRVFSLEFRTVMLVCVGS